MADTEKRNFAGPKIEHDSKTGLSHFTLSTTDILSVRPEIVQLHGLLSDLPEISFTVNYEDGPGNEWQDILSNFMTNDLMAIFNTIGAKGAGFKNIVKAGSWTKKVYAGYAPSTIPLKFRIYTRDTFGQSSAEMWKKYLIKFASINDGNKFEIDTAAKNIFGAIKTAYNSGEAVAGLANSSLSNFNNSTNATTAGQSDSDDEKYEKYMSKAMTVYAQMNAVNEALGEISKNASADGIFKIDMKIEKGDTKNNWWITGIGGGHAPINFTASVTDTRAAGDNVEFGPEEVGKLDAVNGKGNPDPNGIEFTYENLKKAFKEFIDECSGLSDEAKTKIKGTLEGAYSKNRLKQAFETKPPHEEKNNDEIHKLGKFLINNADALGEVMVSKYGQNRVYETMNAENSLGEKLWHLNIYNNVIFNTTKPLVVYISEWSYKASEERDGNEPVYYDFEITCALDQVYSRKTWYNILARPKPATKPPTNGV